VAAGGGGWCAQEDAVGEEEALGARRPGGHAGKGPLLAGAGWCGRAWSRARRGPAARIRGRTTVAARIRVPAAGSAARGWRRSLAGGE
jgi:hypothetical protein